MGRRPAHRERARIAAQAQILALYDQLTAIMPTPVVALNRCVAVAETRGPAAALELVDQLNLDSYLYHSTRADLLRRLGRTHAAAAAYDQAIARTANHAEQAFLQHQRDSL